MLLSTIRAKLAYGGSTSCLESQARGYNWVAVKEHFLGYHNMDI